MPNCTGPTPIWIASGRNNGVVIRMCAAMSRKMPKMIWIMLMYSNISHGVVVAVRSALSMASGISR